MPPFLSFFDQIEDFVLLLLAQNAFLAPIVLLILEEAGFPLPVADATIIYTGYEVSRGHISYLTAFLVLLAADLLGASILYFLCVKYGRALLQQIDRWIDLDEEKMKKVEQQFRRWGALCIIIGRHLPGFRIPITIFSGISGVSFPTFIISTFLSVFWWIMLDLSIGQRLGPRSVRLLHHNPWYGLLIAIPIIVSIAPIFFLRKKKKINARTSRS